VPLDQRSPTDFGSRMANAPALNDAHAGFVDWMLAAMFIAGG
jgi:hypothetical protein